MGGGPEQPVERILFLLPQPEPTALLQSIRAQFPNVELTWITNQFVPVHDGRGIVGILDDQLAKTTAELRAEAAARGDGDAALVQQNGVVVSKDLFREATVLMTLTTLPEGPADAPNLKLVHLFSAGTDRVLKHPLFLETDIVFTNSSGVHGPQIAEWVIMTLLVSNHDYLPMYEAQKQRNWSQKLANWNMNDLVGQRIGILGYGAIGRQVARVTSAMGMEVYAYTATKKETPEERRDHGYIVPGTGDPDGSIPAKWFSGLDKESLHNFLSQKLDVIVISVPLTPETHHLLSTPEFALLSHHPPLISNIARGPIIDQPALIAALHAKHVAAATLDVADPEPLPADSALWTAPNVIVTPHISAASSAYLQRSAAVLVRNLGVLVGRDEGRDAGRLVNVISRRKGY